MVVGWKRRRLDDERVRAAHVLEDLDENLVVGKTADAGLGQRQMKPVGDFLRQRGIGGAGNELDGAVLGRHRRFSSRLAGYHVQHIERSSKPARFDERGDIKCGAAGNPLPRFSRAKMAVPPVIWLMSGVAEGADAKTARSGLSLLRTCDRRPAAAGSRGGGRG